MINEECKGCQVEMEECYKWQSEGFDAGLEWNKWHETKNLSHCFVFVFNKKGELIVF